MIKNIYFYVEDLGLSTTQRNIIVENLQSWGNKNSSNNPKDRNHWRIRIDSKAALYELWVDENNLTPIFFQNSLGSIFGVNPASITFTVNSSPFGPYIDFSYGGLPKLRLGVFGGVNATYRESQIAVQNFLVANSSAWD